MGIIFLFSGVHCIRLALHCQKLRVDNSRRTEGWTQCCVCLQDLWSVCRTTTVSVEQCTGCGSEHKSSPVACCKYAVEQSFELVRQNSTTFQCTDCRLPERSFEQIITTSRSVRWPSAPDFPGQSWFFTTRPGKNHSSPGSPICPVFGLVSRICPQFAHLCSCMLVHRWPKFSSDFVCVYEKSLAAGDPARYNLDPAGELTTLPQTHNLELRWLTPSALVLDCGVQIMVT